MASPAIIAALTAGLVWVSPPDAARRDAVMLAGGDCGAAASKVLRETGGQLLSAQPSGDGQSCVVTVLVQGDGTVRPRKVTVRVPT